MHKPKNDCSCKHLEITDSCFTDFGILLRRIIQHGKQIKIIIVPKTLRQKIIISDSHGDIMTGHENKNKTKERIMSSYWRPGIDTEIDIHIKSCDKCQRTRKNKRGSSTTFTSPLPQCSELNICTYLNN
jgi:hypothetical protein